MPTTFGLNARAPRTVLYKAKKDDFIEVGSFQGTLPHLGALESPSPLQKTSEHLVLEASMVSNACCSFDLKSGLCWRLVVTFFALLRHCMLFF